MKKIEEFRVHVDAVRFCLVESWCLCKYCQTYDPDNAKHSQWIAELRTIINDIKTLNIERGDKVRVLTKMLIDDYDYDKVNMIWRIVEDRFCIEKITNPIQTLAVCKAFADAVGELVEVLGDDHTAPDTYLKQTFNLKSL